MKSMQQAVQTSSRAAAMPVPSWRASTPCAPALRAPALRAAALGFVLAGCGVADSEAQATAQSGLDPVGGPRLERGIDNPAGPGIRGLVNPLRQAVLSAQVEAVIESIPYRDGEHFKAGDVLVQLECGRYQAELEAAQAESDSRRRQHQNVKQRRKLNAASDIDVEIAWAEARKARASARLANIRVGQCTITAPYDGTVVELLAQEHESVGPQQAMVSIIGRNALEIELIVPSEWLARLRPGTRLSFTVDETGQTHDARINRLGAQIDPASQTGKVVADFEAPPDGVRAGMSGAARFEGLQ